jgi:hypothetical protein
LHANPLAGRMSLVAWRYSLLDLLKAVSTRDDPVFA